MRISDWSSDVCSSDLKPQSIQSQDPFQVREQHLDLLAVLSGLLVSRRGRDLAGHIARGFVDLAGDLAMRRVRTTPRLQLNALPVISAALIDYSIGRGCLASGTSALVRRATSHLVHGILLDIRTAPRGVPRAALL